MSSAVSRGEREILVGFCALMSVGDNYHLWPGKRRGPQAKPGVRGPLVLRDALNFLVFTILAKCSIP